MTSWGNRNPEMKEKPFFVSVLRDAVLSVGCLTFPSNGHSLECRKSGAEGVLALPSPAEANSLRTPGLPWNRRQGCAFCHMLAFAAVTLPCFDFPSLLRWERENAWTRFWFP